jgi:hypothetical protein
MLKILYLRRLKSTSFMQNNYISHLVGNYALNPPLASVNTLINLLKDCTIVKRPPGHL